MNIVMSANNNEEFIVFPAIPSGLSILNPSQNEEFQTINSGTLNLIGDLGLRSLTISSIFPKDKKSWAKAGSVEGVKYIEFFKKWRSKKVPFRIIITLKDGSEFLNMSCLVESFEYSFDKVENIRYSLELKEYIVVV